MAIQRVGWRPYMTTQVVNAVDADATAFIAAAGITNLTQASAVNTLVNDLKTYGLWTKMKALYPMVGGTATSHKFNLKDPRDLDAAFRLVFNGGWIHSSTGALPNGTTGYADTYLNSKNILTPNNLSIGLYTNTNRVADTSPSRVAYGNADNTTYVPLTQLYLRTNTNKLISDLGDYNYGRVSGTNTSTAGFYVNTRTANNSMKVFKNNSLFDSSTTTNPTNTLPNSHLYFAAFNERGAYASSFEIINFQFFYVSDGLTDAEATSFYTAVQKFQTSLGRQIGSPIVSDTDAQAFINAAGLTDLGQANAVNTLVVDLKAAGVWTKMKAVYPFVGGNATSHKFNLKDPRDLAAAYALTFVGGMTHTSSGAVPNGTNAYALTSLTTSTTLANNSQHLSFYSRTNQGSSTAVEMGALNAGAGVPGTTFALNSRSWNSGTPNYFIARLSGGGYASYGLTPLSDTRGFAILSRTDLNAVNAYWNGTSYGQSTQASIAVPTPLTIFGRAYNVAGSESSVFSSKTCAFASIGDGLTSTEASSLYTAVQKYQTSLGRQI